MIWADVPRNFLPLTENIKYCRNNESLYANHCMQKSRGGGEGATALSPPVVPPDLLEQLF